MTTMDAAAARRRRLAVALASVVGLAGLGLAGCGGGSLFGSESKAPEGAQPTAVAQAPIAKVAINSIVGPPDALGKQLQQNFASALEQQRVAVAHSKGEPADYNLRPYILAAKEKRGTKVSYVLDVSEPNGKRVNRFAGEEVVPGSPSRDPWAAITPTVAQAIAAKATSSFAAWVASSRPTAVAQPANAPIGVGVPKSDVAASPRPAAKKVAAVSSSSAQTTGSIAKEGGVLAVVPTVSGAPGDGNTTLTAAIHRELQGKGVALATRPTPAAYRVEGAVTMGQAREGKQPIQIEWVVKDPKGKKLGTVSQKNDVPQGRLDDKWGDTADQAARAAVVGILKLLPPAEAVN